MNLREVVKRILSKGILAADESTNDSNSGTMDKRLLSIGVEPNAEKRLAWREVLFGDPDLGLSHYLSAVILSWDMLRIPYVREMISAHGLIIGIKVDKGLMPFPGDARYSLTKGLDTLSEQLAEARALSAQFAKWRAVIPVLRNMNEAAIEAIAIQLAIYAKTCLSYGIVPIVEPEVLMKGTHSSQECAETTHFVLKRVFYWLDQLEIDYTQIILKPNMIVPGDESGEEVDPEKVANMTLSVFKDALPWDLGGVAFLSGGLSSAMAILCLNEINKLKATAKFMKLSGITMVESFGRALQAWALRAWGGDPDSVQDARDAFLVTAMTTREACEGSLGAVHSSLY